MSRRERVREATREEIKSLARRQMAANGTAALALNAIAREMEMVPSALYRYYPDRDALITALLVDAFEGLALALQEAVADLPQAPYATRLMAAAHVYRSWALEHPIDFQLIFGNPIPGYQAPLQQTGPAMQRVFGVFLDVLQSAHRAGQLQAVSSAALESLAVCHPGDFFSAYDPTVMYAGLVGWTTMHGMVMLELFGHLQSALAAPSAFYTARMQSYLAAFGLQSTP